jgi:hypothetical protein
MHRKNWKDSNGSDRAWSDYRVKLLGALESYGELFAVRLLALEAASDAVSAKRFVDAERLVDMVFSTNHLVKSAENRQFEGEAIVALLVNLLSYNSHSQSVEHLAWDVHSSLLSSYGKVNRFVMELEFAIGSAVYSKSLSMRREGLIANSIEHLQSASRRFGSGGGVGRDLAFMAMRLACGTGLGGQCIDSAAAVISNPSSDVEDYFFSSHWMGKALWRSGSFLKAAEVLLRGADRAVNSELKDHSSLILEDLNLAGLIYSDLMLWEKTLEVRSLIKKATKIFDLPESSHREILAWTAGAIRSGAFEVAAELSSNSSRNSFDSKESSDFFVIFSRALSSYAKVRSNLETGVSLDMAMSDLVAHLNKDSTALSSVFLDRVSVDVFIREISDYRRRQIIDTYRSSVFNFEPSELYVRLEQLKNDIEKYQLYCKVYSFQVTIPTSDNGTCSTNDTRTMLSYAAALRNVYARAPESERSQVDSKFSTHLDIADAQLRTLLSLSANSYERKSALPSVFEYRNTNGMAILGSELSR